MKFRIIRVLILGIYINSVTSFASENNILKQPIIRGSNTFTILDMYKSSMNKYTIEGKLHEVEGIVFVFLCSSNSDKDKIPSLSELTDFQIDGRSYREITIEKIGTKINSNGAVFDVEDFTNKYRPDLKKYLLGVPKKSIIMITTVYGSKLPKSGVVTTKVKLAWIPQTGVKVQTYEFKTNLSNLEEIVYLNTP